MSVLVRPADLDTDGEQIIKLLAASVNPRYDRARFEWLYRQNPDGPVQGWVAVDAETDEIVGTAAAVPRRVHVGEGVVLAWVLSDFAISERYRALGPALQLQRACLTQVASGAIPFCYDFPSEGMLAIYRRLHIGSEVHLRRYVRPLRVERAVRPVGLPGAIARPAITAGNALLGIGLRSRSRVEVEVGSEDGRCGAEFFDLDRECARDHAACACRSPEYLRWRFLSNPFQRHEIVAGRRGGRLLAYVVVTSEQETPSIVDVFGPADASLIRDVLKSTLSLLRDRGAQSVSVTLNEGHAWTEILRDLGFRARERRPLIVYGPKAPAATRDALASSGWLVTSGEWGI